MGDYQSRGEGFTAEKPARINKMPVMEVFGPTIQGEGMVVGRKTMFVRTGGCDYSCSWCDSAFTWNGTQKADMMTAAVVWERLLQASGYKYDGKLNFNHVTISGGNPALIKGAMDDLFDIFDKHMVKVGLETQGSRWQDWFLRVSDLTISPKPPSSGMETNWEKLDEIVEKLFVGGVNFTLKVVIFDDKDFEYAKQVYQRYWPHDQTNIPFYVSVGNEDAYEEGKIAGRLLEKLDWLWNKVLEDPECNNWRPLPQLHTLVWDNKRGV